MIASKAARLVLLVRGTPLVDFGLRRAHGAEAGLYAARASYLAGFSGTATVLAAALFEIPLYGTMAHSFIQAHKDELEAFEQFAASQPANVILLIDTYDTEAAAAKVVALAPRLRQRGIAIKGVRLDSGDLVDHARRVRRILDEGGMNEVQIVVSGNLHERTIKELIAAGAPVDSFAVGTDVTTSADVPYLDSAYKLQEYAGRPRRKRSEGKATWPGRKQVYRYYRADGTLDYDIVTLASDHRDDEALLQPVMQDGRRLFPPRPLGELREHAAHQLNRLPDDLRSLRESPIVPVQISSALRDLAASLDHQS
jgi:nicotinate phosphoribosyltransferase